MTYNGQTAIDVATGVTSFNMTYSLGTKTLDVLDNMRALLRYQNANSVTTNQSFTVSSSNSCSQYFLPTLPNGTTSWSLGGLRIFARKNASATVSATDKLRVQIRTANTDRTPTSTVLASAEVNVRRLGTDFEWVVLQPKLIRAVGPTTGLCITVDCVGGTAGLVDVAFQQGSSAVMTNATIALPRTAEVPGSHRLRQSV